MVRSACGIAAQSIEQPHYEGDEWWKEGLPWFVRCLLITLHSAQSRRNELEVRLDEWHAISAELRAENEELRSELRYVEGREDALLEVIRRCRWS